MGQRKSGGRQYGRWELRKKKGALLREKGKERSFSSIEEEETKKSNAFILPENRWVETLSSASSKRGRDLHGGGAHQPTSRAGRKKHVFVILEGKRKKGQTNVRGALANLSARGKQNVHREERRYIYWARGR